MIKNDKKKERKNENKRIKITKLNDKTKRPNHLPRKCRRGTKEFKRTRIQKNLFSRGRCYPRNIKKLPYAVLKHMGKFFTFQKMFPLEDREVPEGSHQRKPQALSFESQNAFS